MPATSSRHGRVRLLIPAVLVAGAIGVAGYFVFRPAGPPLPEAIDLAGVDPQVAKLIRTADQKVRAAPRNGKAWGRLGQVCLANDYYPQGQACLLRAEELDPREPRWPYLLAGINSRINPLAEAKVRRAIELCPADRSLAPRLLLAELLLDQNRLEEAGAELTRAGEAFPGNPWCRLGLARVAAGKGDVNKALTMLGEPGEPADALRTALPKAFHSLRAELLLRSGDSAGAAAEARKSRDLSADPGPPDPYADEMDELATGLKAQTKRTDNLLRAGRIPEALELLEETVRDYPGSDLAWLYLGKTLLAAGRAQDAEPAIREAVRLAPRSAFAHALLGDLLAKSGQSDEAISCYRRAVECQPGFHPAYVSLGEILEKRGDTAGALKSYRDAVRHAPERPDTHFLLGRLLRRLGRYAEAAASLRDALALNPDLPEARKLLEEPDRPGAKSGP